MDERLPPPVWAGLTVHVEQGVPAAALRYFSRTGAFAAAARAANVTLPETGQASDAGRDLCLAWRSPTETLCLSRTEQRLRELKDALAGAPDGCWVELSGGLSVVHLDGERIEELLSRLGSNASMPACGEARRSRMADVPVLALRLRPGAVQLVLDRAYTEHLLAWIRVTLLDFA
jgi:heterotetrameric sarcosine oxidase gamma subunit